MRLSDQAGQQYGDYLLVRRLGVGGMGVVYLARHLQTGHQAALKTVGRVDSATVEAIYREIQILSHLDHPGIVHIVDHGMKGGAPWYAMEWLQGETLRDLYGRWFQPPDAIAALAELDPAQRVGFDRRADEGSSDFRYSSERELRVLRLVRAVCESLIVLHGAGLVHGDLNPSNIFIRPGGEPVLFDFGLSSRFSLVDGRAALEPVGTPRGTPKSMAPEQILGERVDARADLYGLGCTLFEGLTGRPVFLESSTAAVLNAHLDRYPPVPSACAPGVRPAFDMLLLRLLAKRPEQRLGYAEDVVRMLDEIAPELAKEAGAPAPPASYVYAPALHGRDRECRRLGSLIHGLGESRGGLVLMTGLSGSGKTSLLNELAVRGHRELLRVVVGECQDLVAGRSETAPVRAVPLHPLKPLLRRIAADCRSDAEYARVVLGDRGPTLARYEPTLMLATDAAAAAAARASEADVTHARVLEDLWLTLEAYARTKPLLLCLDDVQWADALTLRLLTTTPAAFFRERGILLVAAARSEQATPELLAMCQANGAEHFEVGPLDTSSIRAMVEDMLAIQPVPAELMGFLERHGEGNPFFVAEYVRAAVAEGLLVRRGGSWRLSGDAEHGDVAALPTPRRIAEMWLQRLSQLAPGARNIAECAAVLGRRSSRATTLRVAQVAEREAGTALHALARWGVLEPAVGSGGAQLRFAHDRQREVIYREIAEERRTELHGRAARVLEAAWESGEEGGALYPSLAHHFREARIPTRAAHYFELAGYSALRNAAPRDAVPLLDQALSLDPPRTAVRAARLHRLIAEASLAIGELRDVAHHLHEALRHAGATLPSSMDQHARFWGRELGKQVHEWLSPGALTRGAQGEQQRQLLREASMALTLMAKFSIFEDDAAGVVTASIASVNAAQAAGEDFGAASAYASLGYSARMLRLDRVARRYFAQAQANAERASDLDDHAEARVNEAAAACGAGDWELGERAARDALVLARSARNPQQAASAQTVGFYVDYYRGRYAQAEGWSTPLRLAAQATGNAQHLGWALVMEATLDQERDALEAAVDKLQRAIGLFRESHDRVSETLAVGILAGVQARRGLWDLGLEHAAQARQRVRARFPVVFTLSRGFEGAADAALWRWQDLLRRGEPVPPHLRRDAFEGCSLYMRYAAIFRVGRPGAHRCLGWAHRLAGQPMRAQLHARCSVALAGKLSMPHTLQQAREELAALGDS